MPTRTGRYTLILNSCPSVVGFAAVASKKEAEGPLARCFDIVNEDCTFGESTWEKAESRMQQVVVGKALEKAQLSSTDLDYVFAGDLLNQCTGSAYGLRDLGVPFLGVYGACSTMAESLMLASLFVETGCASRAAAVTSSHFCSAEKQYRYPLEYGGLRPPSSQWTVTGAGAAIVGQSDAAPYIRAVTAGRIEDLGIKDANNMGAAMAPAAASTIKQFLEDTQTQPSDYDLILTGDLGQIGSDILYDLLRRENIEIAKNHSDCGLLIFDREKQDVHAGGSGCGCSASVLCSYILSRIRDGELKNVLFIATGALLSPTSVQQGQSIPGIAHLVHISNTK
ncbi:stage V sporulation protein AD [Zongyangia hominis]|uniref:Stage V sporulation protein AD n=1 Tax=Zongyangia hominis TaxID=2763677 RepID=A0A926EEF5_9FIRM|nr:stage V sporulation protein AD [Zongyangia hominis]MBC8570386.1 stage V sporulation protein AD [Zongyangia hominis]